MADFNKMLNASTTVTEILDDTDLELGSYVAPEEISAPTPAKAQKAQTPKQQPAPASVPAQLAPKAEPEPVKVPAQQLKISRKGIAIAPSDPGYPVVIRETLEAMIVAAKDAMVAPYSLLFGQTKRIEFWAKQEIPTLYCIGNPELLKSPEMITIGSSEGSSFNTFGSIAAICEYLAENANGEFPTVILPVDDSILFSFKTKAGKEVAGAIESAIKNGLNVILVLAKAPDADTLKRVADPIAQGRLLVVSLIDPYAMNQKGSLELSELRFAIVAAISKLVTIIEILGTGGIYSLTQIAIEQKRRCLIMDLKGTKEKPLSNPELIDQGARSLENLTQITF